MEVSGRGVDMVGPIKDRPIGDAEVFRRLGVGREKGVEVQALLGDSPDKVPGVPGIGPTAASACINMFGTLANVLDAAEDTEKFVAVFQNGAETAEKELFKLTGRPCKYGPTSRELGALLFEELKLAGGQTDAKGNWHIGTAGLQALAGT